MQWILLMLCLCFIGCLDQFQSSGSESNNNNETDGGTVEGEGEGAFMRPDAGEGEGEGTLPIPDVGIREDDAGEVPAECEDGSACSAPIFIGCSCDAEHVLICTSEVSVCRNQACVLTKQNEKTFCNFGCSEGVCLTEVNCDDQNPCTIDTAIDNSCYYETRAEWDSCGESSFCLHSQRGIECKEVTCPSADPCLVGMVDLTTSVPDFPCRYERLDTPECNVPEDNECQQDFHCLVEMRCVDGFCVPELSVSIYAESPFGHTSQGNDIPVLEFYVYAWGGDVLLKSFELLVHENPDLNVVTPENLIIREVQTVNHLDSANLDIYIPLGTSKGFVASADVLINGDIDYYIFSVDAFNFKAVDPVSGQNVFTNNNTLVVGNALEI